MNSSYKKLRQEQKDDDKHKIKRNGTYQKQFDAMFSNARAHEMRNTPLSNEMGRQVF